ncbi:MAG: helix-turn-helix domain-containing protein [Nitriliruptorales bacterium]|nr:helix-turn-helix domain-containing protein [Nitriliruptorales bacterium]
MEAAAGEGARRQRATPAEARALAHPFRLRILRLCLDEELTNKELAQRLGKDPGTVLHHVRMLVDNGFLAAGEPRRGRRNSRERPYLATRKSWILDFGEEHAGVYVAVAEAFVAELREAGPKAVVEWSRLGVRLSRDDRDELVRRMQELVADAARRDDPEGEPLGLYLAVHRRPRTRPNAHKETA